MWGELSSEYGASFLWGELSWGELSLGRVVRIPVGEERANLSTVVYL